MPGFATPLIEGASKNYVMPKVESNLCDVCANIPVQWLLTTPRNTYTLAEYQDMQESAKSCGLCKLILGCVNPDPDWTPVKIDIFLSTELLNIDVRVSGGGYTRELRVCTDPGKLKLLGLTPTLQCSL